MAPVLEAQEVLATSTSLCPECFAVIDCKYVARGDEVWQDKQCLEHGAFSALYWHGVEHFQWTRTYDAPACGTDSGCCTEGSEDRKRCLAVIDVTRNCNMACAYCFASSRPGLPDVPRETIRGLLETTIRQSGGPTPIQFSGGEPTVRDDLPEIIQEARGLGFTHIEVNSNGLRIASQPGYTEQMAKAGATTVYLQFDGFGDQVYTTIRNQAGLEQVKRRAVEACRRAGLSVILVPTVVKGANEHQLGDILRYALENLDTVRGVNFQPVSHFGRYARDAGHLSLPAVAKLIEDQTSFLKSKDLLQVPCCSPNCSSATMLLNVGLGKVMPLTRFVSDAAYRDIVAAFEGPKFMDLLAGRPQGIAAAKDAAACCGIPVPPGLERLAPRMLAVTVTGFMDADTVDVERLSKCCINVPMADGSLVPFCGYNLTDRQGRYALRPHYERLAAQRRRGLPVMP